MLSEIELKVYAQLFAEGSLCPEPVEVASLLKEHGVEPTEEAMKKILSLLYEDFLYNTCLYGSGDGVGSW